MSEESSEVPQQLSQSAANHISAGGNVSIGNITMISSTENLSRVNLPNAITCKNSSTFIGREQELEFLWGSLEKHHLAIISGMYGSGKTELAKQFIRQYGSAYLGGIFWADRNSKIEQIADSFFTHRKNFQKDFTFLLVWDDFTGEHAVLLGTWQTQFGGNLYILITIQEHLEGSFVCLLKGLSFEESIQLLQNCIGNDRISSTEFYRSYNEERLVERLGNLPIAIEAVGQFLSHNTTLSVSDLLEEIEHAGLSHPALVEEVGIPLEDFWEELDEISQKILCAVGLLPAELLKKPICSLFYKPREFVVNVVELLCNYNLVSKTNRGEETHFTINPIVKLFLERKLIEHENPDEIVEEVIQVLLDKAYKAYKAQVYRNSKFLCEDAIRIANEWSKRKLQGKALESLADLTLRYAFKETCDLSDSNSRYFQTSRHRARRNISSGKTRSGSRNSYLEDLLDESERYYFEAKEIFEQCGDDVSISLRFISFLFKHVALKSVLIQCFKVIRCFVRLVDICTKFSSFLCQNKIKSCVVFAFAFALYVSFQHSNNPEKMEEDNRINNLEDTHQIPADTDLETPTPSPNTQLSPKAPKDLSFEVASNLVWSYLEAKKEIYSSPYDKKKIEGLAGGKFAKKIQSNLEIYKTNEVSLSSYENLGFKEIKNGFSCDKGICVFVVEVKRKRVQQGNKNPKQKTTCLEQGTFKYTLQNENGEWKIYDQEEVTSTTDGFCQRSKTSGVKTKHCCE